MIRLHSSALMACLLGMVAAAACGGDDSDNPQNASGKGGAGGSAGSSGGKGGTGGKGGAAGKAGTGAGGDAGSGATGGTTGGGGGSGGKGGTAGSGGSGQGGTSGTAGTNEGGMTNEGGTGNEGGMVNPPLGCNVYDPTRPVVDIPTDGSGNVDFGSGTELTLTNDTTWKINGRIFVGDGKTLNIESCTLIVGSPKGNPEAGSLFITRGGKINAVGTADEPIVFSSTDAVFHPQTPWGGVVLLGKAPIGEGTTPPTTPPYVERPFEGLAAEPRVLYGGDDAEDDSGTMQYVRIEYGGDIIVSDKEVNGLTLAGVGRGTTLDHIMVKRQRDDCFEFFGGTVDAHHLICENSGDDMFDTDEMYNGYLQFLFGRLNIPGTSADPNGFEWDGNQPNTAATVRSTPRAANATVCGLTFSAGATSYGAVLRRGLQTGTLLTNTIVTGFSVGVDTRDAVGTTAAPVIAWNNSLFFEAITVNVIAPPTETTDNDSGFDELLWITDAANLNGTTKPAGFDCYSATPAPFPTTAVPGTAAGAGFADPAAAYVGAFEDATDNWMTGVWVDWSSGG